MTEEKQKNMEESMKQLWVDRWQPKTLDDYVLDSAMKEKFKNMVKHGSVQNFTLTGCAGSGKTTLAKILARETNASMLFVKCATEGTIDVLRTVVEPFCNALSFDGRRKIVILDELDAASGVTGSGSGFQSGLRTLIEAAQDDTSFIVTCNYIEKIIPAVLSRCPVIPLKFGKLDLLVHLKKILDEEHVKCTRESMKAFIDEAFKHYPDCRRIINYLQFCSSSGELVVDLKDSDEADASNIISMLVEQLHKSKNMLEARKLYMTKKDCIVDFTALGSALFKHVVEQEIVVDLDGIMKMSDMLYQLNVVIDKEAGFFGLLTAVAKWMK
jgi:DNA polymerase III delta prime subunit